MDAARRNHVSGSRELMALQDISQHYRGTTCAVHHLTRAHVDSKRTCEAGVLRANGHGHSDMGTTLGPPPGHGSRWAQPIPFKSPPPPEKTVCLVLV